MAFEPEEHLKVQVPSTLGLKRPLSLAQVSSLSAHLERTAPPDGVNVEMLNKKISQARRGTLDPIDVAYEGVLRALHSTARRSGLSMAQLFPTTAARLTRADFLRAHAILFPCGTGICNSAPGRRAPAPASVRSYKPLGPATGRLRQEGSAALRVSPSAPTLSRERTEGFPMSPVACEIPRVARPRDQVRPIYQYLESRQLSPVMQRLVRPKSAPNLRRSGAQSGSQVSAFVPSAGIPHAANQPCAAVQDSKANHSSNVRVDDRRGSNVPSPYVPSTRAHYFGEAEPTERFLRLTDTNTPTSSIAAMSLAPVGAREYGLVHLGADDVLRLAALQNPPPQVWLVVRACCAVLDLRSHATTFKSRGTLSSPTPAPTSLVQRESPECDITCFSWERGLQWLQHPHAFLWDLRTVLLDVAEVGLADHTYQLLHSICLRKIFRPEKIEISSLAAAHLCQFIIDLVRICHWHACGPARCGSASDEPTVGQAANGGSCSKVHRIPHAETCNHGSSGKTEAASLESPQAKSVRVAEIRPLLCRHHVLVEPNLDAATGTDERPKTVGHEEKLVVTGGDLCGLTGASLASSAKTPHLWVVAVDGSMLSQRAFEMCFDLAQAGDSVLVVHSFDPERVNRLPPLQRPETIRLRYRGELRRVRVDPTVRFALKCVPRPEDLSLKEHICFIANALGADVLVSGVSRIETYAGPASRVRKPRTKQPRSAPEPRIAQVLAETCDLSLARAFCNTVIVRVESPLRGLGQHHFVLVLDEGFLPIAEEVCAFAVRVARSTDKVTAVIVQQPSLRTSKNKDTSKGQVQRLVCSYQADHALDMQQWVLGQPGRKPVSVVQIATKFEATTVIMGFDLEKEWRIGTAVQSKQMSAVISESIAVANKHPFTIITIPPSNSKLHADLRSKDLNVPIAGLVATELL